LSRISTLIVDTLSCDAL